MNDRDPPWFNSKLKSLIIAKNEIFKKFHCNRNNICVRRQLKSIQELLTDLCRMTNILINPHMHKMGPRGPKYCNFGNQFYSKNPRKLRFHVFPHFNARKNNNIIILREVDRINKNL